MFWTTHTGQWYGRKGLFGVRTGRLRTDDWSRARVANARFRTGRYRLLSGITNHTTDAWQGVDHKHRVAWPRRPWNSVIGPPATKAESTPHVGRAAQDAELERPEFKMGTRRNRSNGFGTQRFRAHLGDRECYRRALEADLLPGRSTLAATV